MSKVKYSKELLEAAARGATSISGVLRALGSTSFTGGMSRHIKNRLLRLGIDTSHFTGRPEGGAPHSGSRQKSAQELLVKGKKSRTKTYQLRRCLIELGVPYQCKVCGQLPTWNGYPLVLQVDHISGDWSDDRPDNLRFLCPPCHTQQPTYGFRGKAAKTCRCQVCGGTFSSTRNAICCSRKCSSAKASRPEKAKWPSPEELQVLVWTQPVQKVASSLGVSEVAVKKRCTKFGISTPPRGYWAKLKAGLIETLVVETPSNLAIDLFSYGG